MKTFRFCDDDRSRLTALLASAGLGDSVIDDLLLDIESSIDFKKKPMPSFEPSVELRLDRLKQIEQLSEQLLGLLREVEQTGIATYQAYLMGRVVDRDGELINSSGLAEPGGRPSFRELVRLLSDLHYGSVGSHKATLRVAPKVEPKRGRPRDAFAEELGASFVSRLLFVSDVAIDDEQDQSPRWLVEAFAIVLRAAHPGNRENDRIAAQRIIRKVRRADRRKIANFILGVYAD